MHPPKLSSVHTDSWLLDSRQKWLKKERAAKSMPELELGDRVGGGESLGPILYEKLKFFEKIFFCIFEKYFFVREKNIFRDFFKISIFEIFEKLENF